MKTIKFFTLGCKVNQYDTQELRERFLEAGFKELRDGKPADVYVINTCTVTRNADSDSLGLIRRAQRENPKAEIFVAGCLTKLDSKRITELPGRIRILKSGTVPRNEGTVPTKAKGVPEQRGLFPTDRDRPRLTGTVPIKIYRDAKYRGLSLNKGISYFKGHTRAFLKIQDGCNNFCSYCKVPLVRGRSRSKPLAQIKEEATRLAANGFKEIVLCGICLGAYGKDLKPKKTGTVPEGDCPCFSKDNRPCLVDAIEALENIDGIVRIRLSSIEAGDVTDNLIDKFAHSKKLCRHLHIPIQSGDNEILGKMRRRYTREDYLNLIKKIKRKVPQIAITTDVLVGFPGESEKHFQNTVGLVNKINPLRVHIFPYSRREKTSAAKFEDLIDIATIKGRIASLKKIADTCAFSYKKRLLGKKLEVLIEGPSKELTGFWEGHSDTYVKILVRKRSGQDLRNKLISVKPKMIVGDCLKA